MEASEIKKIRKKLGLNQTDFGKLIGVRYLSVQRWESGKTKMQEPTAMLLKEKLKELSPSPQSNATPATLQIAQIPFVPIHAHAGFLSGYGDTLYMNDLPTEVWEVDKEGKGNYVIFDVRGDSMDDGSPKAILDGDKILCRELHQTHWSNKLHYNQWYFVIAHIELGIVVKQITSHDVEKGVITCHSLNDTYEDFEMKLKDVKAIFNVIEVKRRMRL